MTKANKQQKGSKKKQVKTRRRMVVQTTTGLDKAAIDHVRLLADPCGAPMVYPAYESPGGGALIRYRKVIVVGALAGETAGAVVWSPGFNENIQNGGVTSVTPFMPNSTSTFSGLTTASGFAQGTAFRCIAACLNAMPNSSEQNRSGLIYMGNTSGNQYYAGNAMDVNNVASGLAHISRVPERSAELVWIPSDIDTDFKSDDGGTGLVQGGLSSSALAFAFTGAQAASGYTIILTGVYEVKFPLNSGIVTTMGPPASKSSWNLVLRAFDGFINSVPVVIDGLRRVGGFLETPTGRATARLGFNTVARLTL